MPDAIPLDPTPEVIAMDAAYDVAENDGDPGLIAWTILRRLKRHGYIIVHPDDVPKLDPVAHAFLDLEASYGAGWNDCRAHIFRRRQ